MICKIIGKSGERGSGGTREAFVPGVSYVCSKASVIALRNLSSDNWQNAASEMLLTAELGPRTHKPYYHLVLSWHAHETPSEDQMIAAMDHLILTLGLADHQAVIGNHDDTPRRHIHAVVNTVHPLTGKGWSKSNDRQKAELACRQIEVDQGWTHDRGRFAFEILDQNGQQIVRLQPANHVWKKKQHDRATGNRQASTGDIVFHKRHGVESFNRALPPPLKARFARAVATARDWSSLHDALAPLGLRYRKHGSGARIHLAGSAEGAKASAFGQAFSLGRMEKVFGPYMDPKPDLQTAPQAHHRAVASVTGIVAHDAAAAGSSTTFKMTLLRRMYCGLHLDEAVSREIRFVALDDKPPRITFRDNSAIVDHGAKISASAVTESTIKATVALAKAKGWRGLMPTGPADYIRGIALEAARSGLTVAGVPPEVQALADQILEHARKVADRRVPATEVDAEAEVRDVLTAVSDQDAAIEEAVSETARRAAQAIWGGSLPMPAAAPEHSSGGALVPPAPHRQPAPVPPRPTPAGKLQSVPQLRANDHDEIDQMKQMDIGVIAAAGGWSDVSRSHPDSSDRRGQRYRIFARGTDTLKCSLVEGKWLWTSNKSARSGSVIDLWLHDNPGKTLGHARAAFRAIFGTTPLPSPRPAPPQRSEAPHDHTAARQRWEAAALIGTRQTYAQERGISPATLTRFNTEVRGGAYDGIYFAHRHPETGDIQGFEQRWQKDGQANIARFAKGGRKTVNVLGDPQNARRMVVFEGGLDALALAEIEAREDTIYVSTGGGFGPQTEAALSTLAKGKEVFSAFDNDPAGHAMSARLMDTVPDVRRLAPPANVEGAQVACKDWLDVLNALKSRAMTPAEGLAEEQEGMASSVDSSEQESDKYDLPRLEP